MKIMNGEIQTDCLSSEMVQQTIEGVMPWLFIKMVMPNLEVTYILL